MGIEEGAWTAVHTCMGVKKGEIVLILTDTEKETIAEALFQAVIKAKGEPLLLKMLPRKEHGEEPLEQVSDIMKRVDVIIAVTKYSLTHTQARKMANRVGVRIATMPGITEDMMSNGGMTANFREIAKNMKRIEKLLRGSREAKITSENGTSLELRLDGRNWVAEDTGICLNAGQFTNLPAGEIFISPVEGSANGTLVVDGAFGGNLLDVPIKFTIKDGYALDIDGPDWVRNLFNTQPKEARNVAELGLGMNPKSKIIGNILEDEKVLGTVHIAFGDNSRFGGRVKCDFHADGIVKTPSLIIDGKNVIEGGKLVL